MFSGEIALKNNHYYYTALEYNIDLPRVMSFVLVTHLTRLVAMVVKFFMCNRKVSNFIYYVLVIYLIFLFFLFTTIGKQHKMPKKRWLQSVLLIFLYVKEKLANLFFMYFDLYDFFIFINSQSTLRKTLKKLYICCYLCWVKKQSYCVNSACFDSD